MKMDLITKGFSVDEISHMTPKDAWNKLKKWYLNNDDHE